MKSDVVVDITPADPAEAIGVVYRLADDDCALVPLLPDKYILRCMPLEFAPALHATAPVVNILVAP